MQDELAGALINAGNAWVSLGRLVDARLMFARGLELAREHRRARWEANALGGLHTGHLLHWQDVPCRIRQARLEAHEIRYRSRSPAECGVRNRERAKIPAIQLSVDA